MNAYTFNDVLIQPCYSEVKSRKDVNLGVTLKNRYGKEWNFDLPIVSANMKTITGPKMAKEIALRGGLGILHRFNDIKKAIEEYNEAAFEHVGVSIGVQESDKERFRELYKAGAKIFCIDVAHGHHVLVKNMVEWISNDFHVRDDILLIAGNIATSWAVTDLNNWGVDVIKVGIGPGSVCQTRNNTGVGVPQLHALHSIRNLYSSVQLIADGGITTTGDIAKALKYANMVMLGGFIAGTSETPGNAYKGPDGQYYKVYGGSASGENKGNNTFVEGMTKTVPFRGKVKYILREIEDGLRSACSYVGAYNLEDFKENCEFIFVSGSGQKESKF